MSPRPLSSGVWALLWGGGAEEKKRKWRRGVSQEVWGGLALLPRFHSLKESWSCSSPAPEEKWHLPGWQLAYLDSPHTWPPLLNAVTRQVVLSGCISMRSGWTMSQGPSESLGNPTAGTISKPVLQVQTQWCRERKCLSQGYRLGASGED